MVLSGLQGSDAVSYVMTAKEGDGRGFADVRAFVGLSTLATLPSLLSFILPSSLCLFLSPFPSIQIIMVP